jgi:hypothetical protein
MSAARTTDAQPSPVVYEDRRKVAERDSRNEQAAVVAGAVFVVTGVVLMIHGVTRQVLRRDDVIQG